MGRKPSYKLVVTRQQGELLWRMVEHWMARGLSPGTNRRLHRLRDMLEDVLPAPNQRIAEQTKRDSNNGERK